MKRNRLKCHHAAGRRGGILLTTLIFAVIIATMLGGLGTLVVSYYSRTMTESQYASSVDLADAGANYELRRINQGVANADMPGATTPPGSAVALGNGTVHVYCTMLDGASSWDKATAPFYVYSTGAVGTSGRTVKVRVNANGGSSFAGVFAIVSGTMTGSAVITGDFGNDGTFNPTSNDTVTGNVVFDGPSAGWSGSPTGHIGGIVTNPSSVAWPTSSAVALTQFPDSGATAPGGYSYLATHNDNATASPAIAGNSISLTGSNSTTLVGKPGGANYYLTSLKMTGSSALIFNNSNGPINIWVGPVGGNAGVTVNGGAAAVSMSSDSTKGVRFYVATTGGVTLTGSSETDAGIYNVTGGTSLTTMTGTSNGVNVTLISDEIKITGSGGITTPSGYFTLPSSGVYKFDNAWLEINGM